LFFTGIVACFLFVEYFLKNAISYALNFYKIHFGQGAWIRPQRGSMQEVIFLCC